MARHFSRSARWRRALVTACLPYLLVSVFVDFVHVHAPGVVVSASAGEASVSVPLPQSAPRPDYTCTACLWLRTGLQLVSSAPARLAAEADTADFVLPIDTIWPDSPTAPPSFLRGPPVPRLG